MKEKVNFNTDNFFEYMKNINIACDNFSKAVAKYMYENRYKILKELIEESNKIMRGDYRDKRMKTNLKN